MYSNIKVYQKYLVTSIKVGCATRSLYASSGPKAEGVPTYNQRGRGSGPWRLWGGLDKARHIVTTAFIFVVSEFFTLKKHFLIPKNRGFLYQEINPIFLYQKFIFNIKINVILNVG